MEFLSIARTKAGKKMETSQPQLENRLAPAQEPRQECYELSEDQDDLWDEGLIEGINSTPIEQLLKVISSLPEIRREKVTDIRKQIDDGRYDIGNNLDAALDLVIEEFIAD